ncbi:MAG: hypothetical protein AB1656_01700 [Candidatus Omnitrophota bacterium]
MMKKIDGLSNVFTSREEASIKLRELKGEERPSVRYQMRKIEWGEQIMWEVLDRDNSTWMQFNDREKAVAYLWEMQGQ